MLADRRIFFTPLLAVAMGLAQVDCSPAVGRYAPATPLQMGDWSQSGRPPKLNVLWPHFERQQTPTSCSVASVATVLNAALATKRRPAVSQQTIIDTQTTGAWARLTANANAPGVTLDQLALYAMQAFYVQGLTRVAVDVVHIQKADENTRQALQSVLERNNQTSSTYFMVANFLQSAYVKAGEAVGHMSVVAQYDIEQARVLILDVDPNIPDPYWVPLDNFLAGMATEDDETGEPRGYLVIREP
jgi:hypothetical protein